MTACIYFPADEHFDEPDREYMWHGIIERWANVGLTENYPCD
jgi:hypothetical protein